MDEGERIPIVFEEAAESGPGWIVREDGVLVIDLMAPVCKTPQPTTEDQIVVCAPRLGGPDILQVAAPEPRDLTKELHRALGFKLGTVDIGSFANHDGTYAFGARRKY